MKRRIPAAVILMLAAALCFYGWRRPDAGKPLPARPDKISQAAAVAAALAKQNPATVAIIRSNFARVQAPPANSSTDQPAVPPALSAPSPLEFTNCSPAIVLENMRRAVRQFGAMFAGNPVGTNPEITRQLAGDNPKHINFLSAEAGMRVNQNGELVDPWGRPYFFHQISGAEMEIRSAGADGQMWTADDRVAR